MLIETISGKALIRQTELRTEPNLRPSLTVYKKRIEPVQKSALLGLCMTAILAQDVVS